MFSRSVKIYTPGNIPRLRYIAGIVLGDMLGLSWEIFSDKRKLGKSQVINYSDENISGSFKISPASLLFEKGISERSIEVTEWNGLPVFFRTSEDSDIPFDIFAASFFLVSRYEEYLYFRPDEFGRFRASSSLSYKNGFLEIPVVDLWAKELIKALLRRFRTITFKRNEYRALLTIDADQPFAYIGKSIFRSIGGLLRDITNNSGKAGERYRIVTGKGKDPFEVFDYIIENVEKRNTDVRFFFPVGDYSRYDKNPSWKSDEYRKLIQGIGNRFKIGIHPSYNASGSYSLIDNELVRLKTITGKEVDSGRFHYIRFFTPQSYRDILKAGIKEDFSMGYPDEPGFRAGIARPYYFYDVPEDRVTDLKITPFQVMDGTLYKYKKLGPEASVEVIMKLVNETRKVSGTFVSIWHNTSLIDDTEWKEWRKVFEFTLDYQNP
jgi:hypothetical protein